MAGRLNARTSDSDEELINRLARDLGVSADRPAGRTFVVMKAIWKMGEDAGHVARGKLVPDYAGGEQG
jgi:hypothetical protein